MYEPGVMCVGNEEDGAACAVASQHFTFYLNSM